MNDINDNNQNRPRLKKIKRPIKRPADSIVFAEPTYGTEEISDTDLHDIDLDSLLDEKTTSPIIEEDEVVDDLDVDQDTDLEDVFENEEVEDIKIYDSTQDPTPPAVVDTPSQEEDMPKFLDEKDLYQEQYDNTYIPAWLTKKTMLISVIASFILGIIISSTFSSPSKVVKGGLQGVVPNRAVPKGRARCGIADRTQGCVLYIMNPQRQELDGRDFYDLAAQLTGRQRFVIETGNMEYSNTKIRPGEIGQFDIPPL